MAGSALGKAGGGIGSGRSGSTDLGSDTIVEGDDSVSGSDTLDFDGFTGGGGVNVNLADSDGQTVYTAKIHLTFKDTGGSFASTIENVNRSSENLASLTGRLDTMLRNHEDDLGQFMEEGLAAVPALMKQTRESLRELEKLVQELQHDPSQLIYRQADNSVEIEP